MAARTPCRLVPRLGKPQELDSVLGLDQDRRRELAVAFERPDRIAPESRHAGVRRGVLERQYAGERASRRFTFAQTALLSA
jgi:hypothetical protein